MTLAAILTDVPVSNLRQEYQFQQSLYDAQPPLVRNFVDQQAQIIAQAILAGASRVRYSLPNRVVVTGEPDALVVPPNQREQTAGRWLPFGILRKTFSVKAANNSGFDLRADLLNQFRTLENSTDPSLSVSGNLMRYSVARNMVYQMLPDGRPVRYRFVDGDEIPSQPEAVAGGQPTHGNDRNRLHVPYPSAALLFFLPQWVAFDEKDQLLTNTREEAEGNIRSMQNFLRVLHHAVTIDPYLVADETYQRKRTGMLGQLVNQGRALACFETRDLIAAIRRRVNSNSLNRGFTLDLTYFDDQELTMKSYLVEVVPAGRIMFVPAFVVLAMRREYARITQDTRLNSSTRKHLLSLLAMFEKAFLNK